VQCGIRLIQSRGEHDGLLLFSTRSTRHLRCIIKSRIENTQDIPPSPLFPLFIWLMVSADIAQQHCPIYITTHEGSVKSPVRIQAEFSSSSKMATRISTGIRGPRNPSICTTVSSAISIFERTLSASLFALTSWQC